MSWELHLTDRSDSPIGALEQVTGRSRTIALSQPQVFSGSIERTNPMAPSVLLCDKTILKVYETLNGVKTLVFLGPITSYEKVADSSAGAIAFTAADIGWRLGRRLIGKTAAGFTSGTAVSQKDRAVLAAEIIAAVNADSPTGITTGTYSASGTSYISAVLMKQALQAINDLGGTIDGFEWRIDPLEPSTNSGNGGSWTAAPALGQARPDAVWEYGTGLFNVASFRDTATSVAEANTMWGGIGGDSGAPTSILTSQNADSLAERGLVEDVLTTDVTDQASVQLLLDENVRVRKQPQRVITFSPVRATAGAVVPVYGVDYTTGDTVIFRAVERFPETDPSSGAVVGETIVTTVNGTFRVYGATLAADDTDGSITAAPTLVESSGS